MKEKSSPGLRATLSRKESLTVVIQAIAVVTSGLQNLLVGRYWGAALLGAYSIAAAAATISAYFVSFGIGDVIVWGWSRYRFVALASWAWLATLGAVILATAAIAAGVLLKAPLSYVVGAAASVALSIGRIHTSKQLAADRIKAFEVSRTALTTLPLIGLGLAAFLHPATHPLWPWLIGLSAAALLTVAIPPHLPVSISRPPPEALRLGAFSTVGNLAFVSLSRSDVLVVGWILGATEAGIYALGLTLAEAAIFASNAYAYHSLQRGARHVPLDTKSVMLVSGLTAAIVGVGVSFLMPALVDYQLSAAANLYWLALPGALCLAALRNRFAHAVGAGNPAKYARVVGLFTLVQTIANILLLRQLTIAIAPVISSACYVLVLLVILRSDRATN